MANPRRNVDDVGQDFNKAVKIAQNAIQQAMAAVKELGERMAQLLKKIEESSLQAKQSLAKGLTGLKGGPTKALDLRPFAKALDTKAADLSQKNQKLANSLKKLRELHGSLPRDSRGQLSRQLNTLEDSIKLTTDRNRQLTSSLAKNAMINSKLPPMTAALQTKAVGRMNAALTASQSGLKPNPNQAASLIKLNMKTAILGLKLSESSRKKTLEVKDLLETKLNETSSIMKQFRVSLQPKSAATPEVKDVEELQTKKKNSR